MSGCAGRLARARSDPVEPGSPPPELTASGVADLYPVIETAPMRLQSCRAVRSRRYLEPYVGVGAGMSFPEKQDLKLMRFDSDGVLIDDLFSPDVDASSQFFGSVHAGAWVTRGLLRDWGFEGQFMYWTTRAGADELSPKPGHVSTGEVPPFDSVSQQRYALFGCIQRRWFLSREGAESGRGPYAFLGGGAGLVYTIVEHGPKDWAPGAEVFSGLAVPFSDRARLRFDVRWITTHDADSKGTSENWRVDTSGRPSWPRAAHFDTRFVVPQLSVEIDL